MNYVTLNNDVKMPQVGLGTYLLTPDDAQPSVTYALDNGYELIDTANAYVNERAVGRGMRDSSRTREQIFLETKLWPCFYDSDTAVVLSLIGIVVTVLMELLSRPVLQCLNVPPEIFEDALIYLRIYLLGIPAILLFNLEAAIFRSVGITRMPLAALAISAALNVVLDGTFVAFLGWGAAGVALVTVLCYIVSSGFLFMRLLKADEAIHIEPRRLRADRASVAKIIRIGLPAGIQGGVFSIANILIQTCINSLGPEVVAASSAALALEFVCYSLLNSFSQACTTFVGQNNGAKDLGRCRKTLKVCLVEDAIVAITMILLVVWQGRTMLSIFSSDPAVLDIAYVHVCTIFPAYVFSMIYENMSGYLRGFGISLLPSVLTALGVCGARFFWVLVVFPASPTFATVMLAYPVSLGLTALLITGALLYCKPGWGSAHPA